MDQILTFHLAINGQAIPSQLRTRKVVGRPSNRIFVPPAFSQRKRPTTMEVAKPAVIRLQPIVSKPLQPYVLRETACDFLECRRSSRRCIVSDGRAVDLGYQVAYCLGARHTVCPLYAAAVRPSRVGRVRKTTYAVAVLLMLALIAAAVIQAAGPVAPVALGRAVGLG